MNKTIGDKKLAAEIEEVAERYSNDIEAAHILADDLLITELEELGYYKTAEAFRNLPKRYA